MTTKLVRKPVIRKNYRLIDFHIYDERPDDSIQTVDHDSDDSDKKPIRRNDDAQFIIQMYSINEQGETCSLIVDDFAPFFYIKVGDTWDQLQVNQLLDHLKEKVGKFYSESILSATLIDRHKLYGFSAGKKHKFAQIVFKNAAVMNKTKNLWYEYVQGRDGSNERKMKPLTFQYTNLVLYESSIPPLLRYFHIQNMSPSGWVSVNTSKCIIPTHRLTTCKYEYICKTSHIRAETEKETRVPYKICSFDIEASSSHGDFPLPVKTYKRLAMNMVDVFRKHAPDDVDQGIQLCKKMVLTAFGYSSFDDIDTVYPKEPISKSRVEKLLERFVSVSMKDVLNNVSADTSDLMNIATAFEKMNTSEEEEGGGFEEEEEEDGEEDDEDTKPMVSLSIKKTTSDLSMTIVELLMSNTHDREYKVSNIDKHFLASGFPPLEGDQVTFIGSTFMNYGESEPYLNHCLVVGGCDNVDGAVIETAKSERELLLQWTQIIQRENPDIIIGYNIFGFDYEFMFRRSQELYCSDEFLMLSRKIGDLSAKIDRETGKMSIENTKIQLASGEYDLKYFKMAGRLQIDMYSYFRRDFNLPSYKLDDVAGQFISDDIKKVMHVEHPTRGPITELYSQNLMGLHVGDYIHIELGGFTSDYYKNGQKFVVVDIEKEKEVTEEVKGKMATNKYNVIMIQGHEHIGSAKSVKWGMAKDDVTPQDIFRLAKGTDADRAKVAKYCIQDCNLVHHLMNKIDVITGYVEMSRICSVPISFLIFRGQGIKLTSYVAKKCMEKETLMPDLEKSKADGGYEGAIVLPPKCSMYMDNPVACVDYSSLYPSSMISQNFSHDSKVWTKEYDLDGKLIRETGERNAKGKYVYDCMPGYEYIDMEFDTFQYRRNPARPASKAVKTKCGKMVCRWAQFPDNRKGIMPSILEELLKARKDTRNMIKTEKDPFMQNILDKRQNGYKVTANSLYGQCGARTSTFYEKDVAACTTATGRMMITYAKRIIEEVYGNMVYETATHGPVKCNAEYVYGDTDSVFFTFNLENPETKEKIRGKPALEMTIEIAQDAANLCTQWLKPPMALAYEKTLMPFILLSKKRYVGMLYEEDPNKGKLKYMGLSLKRRDSCDYLKDVYGGILNILMKEHSNIQNAIDFLDKSLKELIEGKVPMDKLMITKALRGDYKNPQQIAHRVLADRIGQRDPGNKPKPGDRMKFIHIVNDVKKALQGEKIETPEYAIANKLKIDYVFYITNQLMKPLQQLFGLALEQIWESNNKGHLTRAFKKDMVALQKEVGDDLETFMKKKEKYCSAKIKALLFDKYLTQIANDKNKMQSITTWFPASTK
jgi:DNA polymerase elongation subunit (family B)